MQNTCRCLGKVILILGFVGSIVLAYIMGMQYETSHITGRLYQSRDWVMTVIWLCSGCFATFATSSIFVALAEILKKIEILEK